MLEAQGVLQINRSGQMALLDQSGQALLPQGVIWQGYARHWSGRQVNGRLLRQIDYLSNKPLVLLWPDEQWPTEPFLEIYYNERMVKYPGSRWGHLAINVSGKIFNFSHKVNENEILDAPEYFYRPALGEFSCGPNGRYDLGNPLKPYYEKFGRQFMRTVHVVRFRGFKTDFLERYFFLQQQKIHKMAEQSKFPDKNSLFNFTTNNCATIIRDGLRQGGFKDVGGLFPRDVFASCAASFYKAQKRGQGSLAMFVRPQLKVPEAVTSRPSALLNPVNYWRRWRCKLAV